MNQQDEIAIKIKIDDDGSWVVENLQEKIKKGTKDISNNFNAANKSLGSWMKNIAQASGIFIGFNAAVKGASNFLKSLVTDTIGFDRELTQVRTLVDESQVSVGDMSDQLFGMAGAMGTVGDLTRGTYMEISSSVPATNALNELTEAAKFAAGGQADLSDSVNLGTTVLNTYGEAAGSTTHVFDVLWQVIKDGKTTAGELSASMGQVIPIARETGLTFEDVGGSLAIMTQISGNTSLSVTALRGIMSSIQKPTKEAADEAERIGAKFDVAAVKSMGFEAWLRQLVDAVQENNGDMAKLFGNVEALNGIYQLTRNNLANFTDEMKKMGDATGNNQEAFEKYLDSFEGSWAEVKNKLQALFVQVLFPLMKEVAKWLRDNSDSIMSFAQNAINGIKTVIGIISQLKDVIIFAGKAWAVHFAIEKIAAWKKAFIDGAGGVDKALFNFVKSINHAKDVFVELKADGANTFQAMNGALDTVAKKSKLAATAIGFIQTALWTIAIDRLIEAYNILQEIYELEDLIAQKEAENKNQDVERWAEQAAAMQKYIRLATNDFGQYSDFVIKLQAAEKTAVGDTYAEKLNYMRKHQEQYRDIIPWIERGLAMYQIEKGMHTELTKQYDSEIRKMYEIQKIPLPKYYKELQTGAEALAAAKKGLSEEAEKLAEKLGILTGQGFVDQSNEIKNLLQIYSQYKGQIANNGEVLLGWVKKIDELWKTALPGEKKALETVRQEMILLYGETNRNTNILYDYEAVAKAAFQAPFLTVPNAISAISTLTGTVYENRDAIYQQFTAMTDVAMLMSSMGLRTIPPLNSALVNVVNNQEAVKKETIEVSEAIKNAIDNVLNIIGAFEKMGMISSQTAGFLQGLVSSIGAVQSGFSLLEKAGKMDGKGFLGFINKATTQITGLISIASAGISIIKGFLSLFQGDGVGQAIDRERSRGISISKEMEEQIRKTEEAIGDTHAAISLHLAEIIQETDITIYNIGVYWERTRDILASLDQGTLTAKETSQALGQAFNELLGEAIRLGTEGSKEMRQLIGDVRNRGLEVAEITDYVNQKLENNVKAISVYLSTFADFGGIQDDIASLYAELEKGNLTQKEAAAIQAEIIAKQEELSAGVQDVASNWEFLQSSTMATISSLKEQGYSYVEIVSMMKGELTNIGDLAQQAGLEVSEGLQEMTNMAAFISQNEELAKRIEATKTLMEGLADTDFMHESDFNSFLAQTATQYQEILSLTGDETMALRMVSPILSDITKYAESYKFAIDDNTMAMIEQARQQGLLQEDAKSGQEKILDVLISIGDVLGAKIPGYLRDLSTDVADNVGKMKGQFTGLNSTISSTQGAVASVGDEIERTNDRWDDAMERHSMIPQTALLNSTLVETNQQIASIGNSVITADSIVSSSTMRMKDSVASIQVEYDVWQGKIYDVIDAIEETEGAVAKLDAANTNYISGNTIIVEWQKWIQTIKESNTEIGNIDNTLRMLDTEFADASTYLSSVFQQFQTQTNLWNQELLDVLAAMETASKDELPGLQEQYNAIINSMNTDTQTFTDYLLGIADQLGIEIPDELTSLGDIYSLVMQQMGNDTDNYMISANGVLMTLDEIIKKQANMLAGSQGFGASYGVYTDEEKAAYTSEFIAHMKTFARNRSTIVGSESNMTAFYNLIKGYQGKISEDYLSQFQRDFSSITQWYNSVKAGKIWDEENKTWIIPAKASKGAHFVVPPGYPNDTYPIWAESDELVHIYTRDETRKILRNEKEVKRGIEYDFLLSTFENERKPKPVIKKGQLSDGLTPVFLPVQNGASSKKIDISLRIESSPKIEIKGSTGSIGKDDLSRTFSALLKDEYRGMAAVLTKKLKEELREELKHA